MKEAKEDLWSGGQPDNFCSSDIFWCSLLVVRKESRNKANVHQILLIINGTAKLITWMIDKTQSDCWYREQRSLSTASDNPFQRLQGVCLCFHLHLQTIRIHFVQTRKHILGTEYRNHGRCRSSGRSRCLSRRFAAMALEWTSREQRFQSLFQ